MNAEILKKGNDLTEALKVLKDDLERIKREHSPLRSVRIGSISANDTIFFDSTSKPGQEKFVKERLQLEKVIIQLIISQIQKEIEIVEKELLDL